MKDKRIWLVILGILVIGILVTGYTRSVVKKQADSAAFEGEISTEASLGRLEERLRAALCREQAQTVGNGTEGEPSARACPCGGCGRAATEAEQAEGGLYRQADTDPENAEPGKGSNAYSIKTCGGTKMWDRS